MQVIAVELLGAKDMLAVEGRSAYQTSQGCRDLIASGALVRNKLVIAGLEGLIVSLGSNNVGLLTLDVLGSSDGSLGGLEAVRESRNIATFLALGDVRSIQEEGATTEDYTVD
jgi:hypothetical protein